MVEVPSAALLAERLADSVDFLSIGTNDLTQYALAAERGNTLLPEFQDALHPAVLRLIKGVVEAARIRGRHVSVCGDAASDPVAAPVFVGLGIRSLSVRPNQVPEIKACFRQLRCSELTPLATLALDSRNATEARGLAEKFLKDYR
jgi:phosphoenolpyruvate-protein kinase (PTS system EI component)